MADFSERESRTEMKDNNQIPKFPKNISHKQESPILPIRHVLPDPAQWIGTWRDDWRVMGQEGYLMNKMLQHRVFDRSLCKPPDFDQCDFCFALFDKDPYHSKIAYFEPIEQVWICEKCFEDFKDHFHWTVEDQIE